MALLCFIHMPRTGGRSIRKAIEASYPPEALVRSAKTFPTDFSALAGRITPATKIVYGHMNFGLGEHAAVEYATLLRDPMSRMLSWYRYWRAWEQREQKQPISFKDFMAIDQSANMQAQMLAGLFGRGPPPDDELLDMAAGNLERIGRLGVYRHIDEFGQALGLASLPHVQDRGPELEFTSAEADAVLAANAVDLALYQRAARTLGRGAPACAGGPAPAAVLQPPRQA